MQYLSNYYVNVTFEDLSESEYKFKSYQDACDFIHNRWDEYSDHEVELTNKDGERLDIN